MPSLRTFAADESGFWGAGVGALWHSGDGRRWRRVQDLPGGRPVDVTIYQGRVYVSGSGTDGRGILWGPPASSSPIVTPGPPPAWPSPPAPGPVDWPTATADLNKVVPSPETYRTHLRDLAYLWALAGPPPEFFEAALDSPFPDRTVSMFGGKLRPGAVNLGRHILLWGMGVAGRGRVPVALLERPWVHVSNGPQKWFDSLPMALFAVSWTGQNDLATVASLIGRLDRAADPAWLRGDIVGALSAVTGKRFGTDIGAWRRWWSEAEKEWPR
jgi:hypothetical protein